MGAVGYIKRGSRGRGGERERESGILNYKHRSHTILFDRAPNGKFEKPRQGYKSRATLCLLNYKHKFDTFLFDRAPKGKIEKIVAELQKQSYALL